MNVVRPASAVDDEAVASPAVYLRSVDDDSIRVSGLAMSDLCAALEHYGAEVRVTDRAVRGRPVEVAGLSRQELTVVRLIAAGLTNQDLADHEFISVNTVKSYIRCAYRKMGVTSRAQAVRWAMDNDIGDPPLR